VFKRRAVFKVKNLYYLLNKEKSIERERGGGGGRGKKEEGRRDWEGSGGYASCHEVSVVTAATENVENLGCGGGDLCAVD